MVAQRTDEFLRGDALEAGSRQQGLFPLLLMNKQTIKPAPGSDEAIAAGCTCPVLDNAHGKGYMGIPDVFVFTVGCPVHNPKNLMHYPCLRHTPATIIAHGPSSHGVTNCDLKGIRVGINHINMVMDTDVGFAGDPVDVVEAMEWVDYTAGASSQRPVWPIGSDPPGRSFVTNLSQSGRLV